MSPRKQPSPDSTALLDRARRNFLAVTASLGSVSLAGCSALIDLIGGFALEDVTVINGAQYSLTGTVTVTDPSGETQLDERFVVGAQTDSSDTNETPTEENTVELYPDVLSGNGSYTVFVSVDTEWLAGDEIETTEQVPIANPSDEHIIVFLQPSKRDVPIAVDVIDSFSDLDQFDEEYTPEG